MNSFQMQWSFSDFLRSRRVPFELSQGPWIIACMFPWKPSFQISEYSDEGHQIAIRWQETPQWAASELQEPLDRLHTLWTTRGAPVRAVGTRTMNHLSSAYNHWLLNSPDEIPWITTGTLWMHSGTPDSRTRLLDHYICTRAIFRGTELLRAPMTHSRAL